VTNFTTAQARWDWYQSSTNMIDQGSVTNAALAGLYHLHHPDQPDKGANTPLTLAHFVAVDGNGNPLDYDGDGLPDYFEDRNGTA